MVHLQVWLLVVLLLLRYTTGFCGTVVQDLERAGIAHVRELRLALQG
jgi:hypothetical protein